MSAAYGKTILLGLLLLLSDLIVAQDIIYFKNGLETQALVLKVDIDDVEYIKFNNQDGPKYVADKGTLLKIVYQNGSLDDFRNIKPRVVTAEEELMPRTELTMKDVYTCKEFIFYGLDFSNFSLIEPIRYDQKSEIKNVYFPAWNSFFEQYVGCRRLTIWYRKLKVADASKITNQINQND